MTAFTYKEPMGSFETQRVRIGDTRGYFLRVQPLKTPQNRNGGGLLYLQYRLNTPAGVYTSAWLAVGVLSKDETKRRQIAAQKAESACRSIPWVSEKSSLVSKTQVIPPKNIPIQSGMFAPSLTLKGNSVEIQRIQIDDKNRIAVEAMPLETNNGTAAGANLFAQNQTYTKDGWQPSFWTHIGYLNESRFNEALTTFKKKVAGLYPPATDTLEKHIHPDLNQMPANLRERKKTLGNLICCFQNRAGYPLSLKETHIPFTLRKKCHEKS